MYPTDSGGFCKNNEFGCTGEQECIRKWRTCNGFYDCYDGSDEGEICESEGISVELL